MTRTELKAKILALGPDVMADAILYYLENSNTDMDPSKGYDLKFLLIGQEIGRNCSHFEQTAPPEDIEALLPEVTEPYIQD